MSSRSTLVYYYIPSDKDESSHPNAFPIPKPPEAIRLRDIREKFPLPGTYHFRFKLKYDTGSVWIDVTNDDVPVPIYNNKIVAKVLRVSWHDGAGALPAATAAAAGTVHNATSVGQGVSTTASAPEVRSDFQSVQPRRQPSAGRQQQQAEANLLSGGESLRHAFGGSSGPSLGQNDGPVVGDVDFFGVGWGTADGQGHF